jgi:hypothetical protein
MVKTGKVTNAVVDGDKTIVDIDFVDNTKATVVLPYKDINKYKDKYVICGVDFHDSINILEVIDDKNE